jgi:hypothetical protein
MQRTVFTVLTVGLLYLGAAALIGESRAMADQGRPAYNPFNMKRAAEAPRGQKEREDFERRKEIIKRIKDHVKPPHHPGAKSPHKPGDDDGNNGHGNDDDHDDDGNPGQGNGGHGTGDHDNNGDNGNHGNGNNGNGKPGGRH